jgi:IS5 family transposase
VDAIAASPSTKNAAQKRDLEMSQLKKGNQWYIGMKGHIGVDARSGLVPTAGVITGKVHDAKVMANLIRENDTAVYVDKGYASDAKKRAAEDAGVLWAVKERAKPGRHLTQRQRARNRRFGKVRAKVERVFRVLKCQFGYRRVRYRGIAKNEAQVFALLALANLYLVRGRLADLLLQGRELGDDRPKRLQQRALLRDHRDEPGEAVAPLLGNNAELGHHIGERQSRTGSAMPKGPKSNKRARSA